MDQLARDELRSAFEDAVRSRNPNHQILNTNNSSQTKESLSGLRLEEIKQPNKIDAWKEAVVGRFRTKRHVNDVQSPQPPLIELPDRTAQLSPELLVPERRPTFWTDVVGKTAESHLAARLLWTTLDRIGNKFDWRDKDIKVWLGSMGLGAISVIYGIEATATFGGSPAMRGLVIGTILQTGWILYESLHRYELNKVLNESGFGLNKDSESSKQKRIKIYNSIIQIEKDIIASKIPKDKVMEVYSSRMEGLIDEVGLSNLLVNQKTLKDGLLLRGSQYLNTSRVAKSITDGIGAGAIISGLTESVPKLFGKDSLRESLGGTRVSIPSSPSVATESLTQAGAEAGQDRIVGGRHIPVKTGLSGDVHQSVRGVDAGTALLEDASVTTQAENSGRIDHYINNMYRMFGKEKIDAIINNPDFANSIAGEVAANQHLEEQIVEESISRYNLFPDEVITSGTVEGFKQAVRRSMEEEANVTYFDALSRVLYAKNGNVDPNTIIGEVVNRASNVHTDWLSSEGVNDIKAESFIYLDAHIRAEADTFYGKVLYGFEVNPEMVQVVDIPTGVSASELLVKNGIDITNTSADAKPLASAIAANWDTLTETWTKIQENNPKILEPDFYYPVSILELNELVTRAENGDEEALKKLWRALKWIPEGKRFRIVKKEYIDTLLSGLRYKYAA